METNYQHYKEKINKFKYGSNDKFFLDKCNGMIGFCSSERCVNCTFHQLNRNSYGYSCRFAQMINEWNGAEFKPIISIDYKKHHFDYNPTTWTGRDDMGRIYSYQIDEKAIKAFKERVDKLCKDITNYEYFAKGIEKLSRLGIPFAVTKDEEVLPCFKTPCSKCVFFHGQCLSNKLKWADELYQEKEIDWENVPLDTKILVREHDYDPWYKRHFAGCVDGKPYAWVSEVTSWTIGNRNPDCNRFNWKYMKLYKEED